MFFPDTPLANRIRKAHWEYHYSNDYKARESARADIERIYSELHTVWKEDPATARKRWEENAPKWASPPDCLLK